GIGEVALEKSLADVSARSHARAGRDAYGVGERIVLLHAAVVIGKHAGVAPVRIGAPGHRNAACGNARVESADALGKVSAKTRLAALTVAHHVDADLDLLAHDLGDMLCERRLVRRV